MEATKPTPAEIDRYCDVFDVVLQSCTDELGHRVAPACVKDADKLARDAVERYRDFCNGKAARE